MAKPCEGNDYLIFALSAAFAGPLLELLNIPGVGFHYYGDSTTGKSSALAVSASTWGPPTFMLSWRGTVNGLESVAASRSSTLTTLDESHLIDPKHLDSGVYLLLNGTSKSRMTRDVKAQELTHWRNCVLSSGERSIEAHLIAAGIDHKAGQGVRVIDVPVTGTYGIFDDLHGAADIRGYPSGSVFADNLRNASAEHYGFAGSLFVQSLISNMKTLNLQAHLSGILGRDKGIVLNAQEGRVERSFALVALAGELAIEYGLLPWEPGCVTKAARRIFNHWRQSQLSSEASKEHSQILRAVSDFTEKHNDSRFSNVNWKPDINQYGNVINEEPVIRDRAGYWEDKPDRPRVYLFTSVGLRDATKSFDHSRVIRALDLAGAFSDKGAKERAKSCRVPDGRSMKLYHIDSSKLKP